MFSAFNLQLNAHAVFNQGFENNYAQQNELDLF